MRRDFTHSLRMTAPATTRRQWLEQAQIMRITGRHPDGRPVGMVLRPRLDVMIDNLSTSLNREALRTEHL